MNLNLLILLLYTSTNGMAQNTLLMVQTVFRHGARAPTTDFTTDEARSYFYRGVGQLTNEGVEQAKFLGTLLSNRYIKTSFLDNRTLLEEVYFRSSPSDRVLITTQTVASSMFPNYPPPVTSGDRKSEFLVYAHFDCGDVLDEQLKFFNISGRKENAKSATKAIAEKAASLAAENTKHLKNVSIEDLSALLIEKDVGLAVPSWLNDDAIKEAPFVLFHSMSALAGAGPYRNPKWSKPKSGFLLHTLLSRIQQKADCVKQDTNKCKTLKKFYAYGTHDIVILSLLDSLGAMDAALGHEDVPDFCGAIIFELWLLDGLPHVKVLYRRHPKETNLISITGNVTNCLSNREFCPIERFTSCCSEYTTSSPESMCLPTVPSTCQ